MTKIKQNNDMTNHTGAIYSEIETELSWSIGHDVIYHEK